MKCVILAGGLGTRLSEETDRIPKPLVEIGGMPILWHIMKIYSAHGVNEFIICVGYKGYRIKEYFSNYHMHNSDVSFDLATGEIEIKRSQTEPWRVHLVETGAESMTGGRLKRVMPYLRDETAFCLTYGDGVGNINVRAGIEFHRAHGRLATVTAVPPPRRFGQLHLDGDMVHNFSEKPIGDGGLINGGFFVLSPKVEKYLGGDESIWESKPLMDLARDSQLMAFEHKGFWQPMDTIRERQQLEKYWASGQAPWKIWE